MAYSEAMVGGKFGLNTTPMVAGLEATGQDWKTGAPLKLNATEQLEECADAADIATQIAANLFMGLAVAPANEEQNTETLYIPYVALQNSVQIKFTSDASAIDQDAVGKFFDLAKDVTTEFWYVDKTVSVSDNIKIMRNIDPAGTTTNGLVEVLFA